MKKIFSFLAVLLCTTAVYGGEIMAIVGDSPISSFDVDQRIVLMQTQQAGFGSGSSSKALKKMILNILVDEKIKGQEALKQGIGVSNEDVKKAIARLETQNNLPSGGLEKVLKEKGIEFNSLFTQIRSDLMWLQILQKHKEEVSAVSEDDVKVRKEKLIQEAEKQGFLVAEILLSPSQDPTPVFEEITKGGDFADSAKKYSIAKSVDNKGFVGWISLGHYPKEVDDVLKHMKGGQLSRPIKVSNGSLIVLMIEKKETAKNGMIEVWELAQMATPKEKTIKSMPTILATRNCEDFMKTAASEGIMESIKNGMINPDQLPPELKNALIEQPEKTALGPIQTPEGDLFFMRCRVKQENILPSDDMIRGQLEIERMESVSDKLLKRLKRYAVIEYK